MSSFFARHWWWIVIVAVLLVCLPVVFVRRVLPRRLPTNPRVTFENCLRIKAGMTLKQVEEILGPAEPETYWSGTPGFWKPTPGYFKDWHNRDGDTFYCISVAFDKSGLVEDATMLPTVMKVRR
jgi:hypothetical protein